MKHATLAEKFNQDIERTTWHDETLWWVRQKRDKQAFSLLEWEELRNAASQIKQHTLGNLHDYLLEFEKKACQNGIQIHWANDAKEHNEIIWKILKKHGISELVKSKSMLTEECGLNVFLEAKGVEVVDTDLGERIVQFREETPSHIVLPAIHLKKEEVSETFHTHLGTEKGNYDPNYLTEAARDHLRSHFLVKKAALTGVNFAIAETGEFVVCTNEGNADMGVHLADVHIASMGIEKVIPRREHLAVFLRLLARSATGQPITTYSSHFQKPREGTEIHVVLVDNGRTRQLAQPDFRDSLKCIRCGACFNTCPVYRRSGGHSYHTAIAGPIGAILSPNLDRKAHKDLPFASTLCGSCTHVCPVKIDIHDQLYAWRQVINKEERVSLKSTMMRVLSYVLSNSRWMEWIGKGGRWLMHVFPSLQKTSKNPWVKQREMPDIPKESFKEWYQRNRSK